MSTDKNEGRGGKKSTFVAPRPIYSPLLLTLVFLLAFGIIMLFSASMIASLYAKDGTNYFILRQALFTLIGITVLWILTRINPARFNHKFYIVASSALSIFLLMIVLIPGIGIVIQGARRWLPLPGVGTFQPSEFTKIAIVLYLGWYYSRLQRLRRAGRLRRAKNPRNQGWMDAYYDLIRPMIPVLFQLFLISLQAHMSAVVIILTVCIFIMAAAGVRLGSWIRGGAIGLSALAVLLVIILSMSALFPNAHFTQRWKHVATRINIFTEDDSVTKDQKLQTEQALLAIGSGQVSGVGLGQSRQKYMYLPENHNDYIFSILCEETGFLGGTFLILLFGAFLFFGIRVAQHTKTLYARILACGYTYLIVLQAYLSIGVNVGLLPPTGISLPFFSYGGTSNIFFLIGAGLLLSVSRYDSLLDIPEASSAESIQSDPSAKFPLSTQPSPSVLAAQSTDRLDRGSGLRGGAFHG